jgi:hypothetical protein
VKEILEMKKMALGAMIVGVLIVASSIARAQNAADYEAIRNHVTCYPFGIDRIGRGDSDAGVAIWKDCFAPDFEFSAFIWPR